MNKNIEKLYNVASKNERLIIGLMSGTSLDGLDIALCHFTGSGTNTRATLLEFETIPFLEDFKNEIRQVFSKKNIDLEKLCLINPWIALQHAAMINSCLKKWGIANQAIDLISSHGQTIYHAPKSLHRQEKFGNATLQIGDGDHVAVATGIITLSDFRQKNIAAGGEGAPLAVYGDFLIFGKAGEDRVLLNIGGIANFTYLPGSMDFNKIVCTDTGPGNTLMDAYTQQQFPGRPYDKDADIAVQGTVHAGLLDALKNDAFFLQDFPKTTGPELFNLAYLHAAKEKSGTTDISVADTMATLNRFSADTILVALKQTVLKDGKMNIYLSGGGMHNPMLVQQIKDALPNCRFYTTDELGIDPDAKEAVLFAVLANECVCGNSSYLQNKQAGIPAVSMGKISFPD